MTIPTRQRAAVRHGTGETATTTIETIDVPQPGPGQILVKINWTGLCGSDKSLLHDDWKDFGVAMLPQSQGIAGHEGAGVVVAVGEGMQRRWKVGDRAGINSGFSAPGTFQEYCLVDGRYTSKIPDGVSDEEAGPIMCGGVTAYTACKRSAVKSGQWLVLPGAGGGLGHLAIQYARAMGMRVLAIDGGDEKRDLCEKLGAEAYIDFQKFKAPADLKDEVMRITKHGAHGVVVTAATKTVYEWAPMYLRPGGTMVVVGLPKDPSILAGAPPLVIALRRLNIVGNITGSLKDVEEALDFTARGIVHPILSKGKLEDLDSWIEKLNAGQLAGRAVLQVAA
ncbi:putative alcohol dehydrogenase [Aspergillus bombycis]|uniref:Putative alcohol dehydrogenase n=1 Tax=Aspergillus bombycis TaxID=109264 RepID=A0A1F8ADQ8_9EURO|nr:putative alcohol dehydrogenase [Aspergillus bombycis]OGM49549.1 putative alcohol dehydrogenase [Aspergillus bombycis]